MIHRTKCICYNCKTSGKKTKRNSLRLWNMQKFPSTVITNITEKVNLIKVIYKVYLKMIFKN